MGWYLRLDNTRKLRVGIILCSDKPSWNILNVKRDLGNYAARRADLKLLRSTNPLAERHESDSGRAMDRRAEEKESTG